MLIQHEEISSCNLRDGWAIALLSRACVEQESAPGADATFPFSAGGKHPIQTRKIARYFSHSE